MSQNIALWGNNYSSVPGIVLPKQGGGTALFTDVTPTTAGDSDVASGKIYFKSDGTQSTGTGSGGGSGTAYIHDTTDAAGGTIREITTDAEITVNSLSVTANGTYTAPSGTLYDEVDVSVSGGGGGGVVLLASHEINVSTASTDQISLGNVAGTTDARTADALIYVRVRDKAGKRAGYFYGSDNYFVMKETASGSITAENSIMCSAIMYTADNSFTGYTFAIRQGVGTSDRAGIYPGGMYSQGNIGMYAKYNASNTGTIDGTFAVDIFAITTPDGIKPFEYGEE